MDDQIRHTLDTVAIPILVTDDQGAVLFCNRRSISAWPGLGKSLAQRHLSDLLPAENLLGLLGGGRPVVFELPEGNAHRANTPSKGTLVEIRAIGWRTADNLPRYTIVFHDVTDHHAAERQSRATLERWDLALRGAHIGVFEVDVATGRSIVSATWKRLMGYDESDSLDAQNEWMSRMHPDDLPRVLAADRACIEGRAERSLAEYRMRTRDGGTWRWMCSDAVAAARSLSGTATRLIGAQTDITDKKAAAEALRLSKEQFQSAFDNAPIGKAIVGLNGSWLRVNAALCDLLGLTEVELLQTDFQTLTHPDDIAGDLEEVRQLLAGERSSYRLEKRYIRSDGAVVWGLLSVALVEDETGAPVHFISQIADITEQRQLARMKSDFVATVSHELRTPLTSILGAMELLTSAPTDELSDETNRLLYIVQQNAARLGDLVNDILDFEKYSSGQMQLAISHERIVDLVEGAVLANMPYAEKFRVRFVVENADRGMNCAVNPQGFQQIMANLLSNAAKFADEGTEVVVSVKAAEGCVRISVANRGAGIPKGSDDLLFQPFSQIAGSSSKRRGGTGLGLSICKQIVVKMRGDIGFESRDGTTCFWFDLPTE